jgi:hypothetical protein
MGWKTGWCTHQSITGVTIGVTIGASIGVATGIDVTKDEKVGGGSIGVSIGASLSSMTGRVVAIGTLFTFDFNGDIDGTKSEDRVWEIYTKYKIHLVVQQQSSNNCTKAETKNSR